MINHLITQITGDQCVQICVPSGYWYANILRKLQTCEFVAHKQIYNINYYDIDFGKYKIPVKLNG